MRDEESKRAKEQKTFLVSCYFSSRVVFRLCFFCFLHPSHLPSTQVLGNSSFILAFLLHPSSFILHHSSLVFKRPARFVTWQRNCPIGQTGTTPYDSPPFSPLPWTTGCSHRALSTGESLFGGDSQAQMFVGSGYSSLPSSSRVNRVSILTLLILIRSPKGCTVGRCFGFDPRRDD